MNFIKNLIKKHWILLVLICLLIPSFRINLKNSHDWGDDFAQYIAHARNIAEGKKYDQTGYIYNSTSHLLGPPSYPPGYPLILATVIIACGESIYNFLVINSIAWLLLGVIVYLWMRKKGLSELTSIAITVVLLYHPWFLNIKAEIISDIPFALILWALLFLIDKQKSWIFLAPLFALLFSTRTVGLIFIPATVFYIFTEFLKTKNLRDVLRDKRNLVFGLLSGIFIYLLLTKILFQTSTLSAYSDHLNSDKNYLAAFQINFTTYSDFFKYFLLLPGNDQWAIQFARGLVPFLLTICILIKVFKEGLHLEDWLFMLYVSFLLVFPYPYATQRFLFPIIPIIIFYVLFVLKAYLVEYPLVRKGLLGVIIIAIGFIYSNPIKNILKEQNTIASGPQQFSSTEMFQYIKENTPREAVFCFKKPRALALYTDRKALTHDFNDSLNVMSDIFSRNNVDYFIQNVSDKDVQLERYVVKNNLDTIWRNEQFLIFKDNSYNSAFN